jgi:CheY-like chemotaxis protein
MEKQNGPRFIIIDDYPVNNVLCEKTIRAQFPQANIESFNEPQSGLKYILSNYATPHPDKTVLLLDIHMPGMSGWDVLDMFKYFPEAIKGQLRIYICSSSIDAADIEKATHNPLVHGYIEKPLTADRLKSMF